jgi:hypothetical protein
VKRSAFRVQLSALGWTARQILLLSSSPSSRAAIARVTPCGISAKAPGSIALAAILKRVPTLGTLTAPSCVEQYCTVAGAYVTGRMCMLVYLYA